jgi:hypothetical protein
MRLVKDLEIRAHVIKNNGEEYNFHITESTTTIEAIKSNQ